MLHHDAGARVAAVCSRADRRRERRGRDCVRMPASTGASSVARTNTLSVANRNSSTSFALAIAAGQ